MSVYRLLFLDEQNQVRGVKVLPYDDEAQAVRVARAIPDGRAKELWRSGRFVGRFPAEPAPASGEPTRH
ncbi:MAG: hypothetical protein JO127_09910 [Caulobacteraceae bacterium]|nr:hypothetical protein [Caulobacteraceae bacterium]